MPGQFVPTTPIQSVSATQTVAANLTVTLTSVKLNSTMVILEAHAGAVASTVTDNQGNTWVRLCNNTIGTGPTPSIWIARAKTAATTIITVTVSPVALTAIWAMEWEASGAAGLGSTTNGSASATATQTGQIVAGLQGVLYPALISTMNAAANALSAVAGGYTNLGTINSLGAGPKNIGLTGFWLVPAAATANIKATATSATLGPFVGANGALAQNVKPPSVRWGQAVNRSASF